MSQLYRTLTGQSQNSNDVKDQHLTPTTSTLTRTTTTDPLSGVLNHLTEAQLKKLEEFKARLQKEGWWAPEGINGRPSHGDGTLLRYLRARKFDVTGAVGQFTDTEKWLKEQRVEELYEHFDVEIYERARVMYPQWTGHRDRRGIPIYVYEIKGLDSKQVSKYQKESQKYKDSLPNHKKLHTAAKMLPLFALYHNLLNFVLPMVSTLERPNPEIPVTNSTNIVDISGVGLTQFWNLKSHMQDASVLATAHYPETLDRIFIIGAPSFFPTVWGWIKRWFDPVTVSKIFILGKHEVRPTLAKFMDPKDIPKKYGGELNWAWGNLPDIDAETRAALEKDGHKGWVRGPCLWLDHERLVVGSEGGKLRRGEKEIQEKKPVVYAADYTEEPVHPDRKASGTGGAANGKLDTPKMDRHPSHHAITAAQLATGTPGSGIGATMRGPNSRPTSRPASQRQSREYERAPEPAPMAPAPEQAPAPTSAPQAAASTTTATQSSPMSNGTNDMKAENLREAPMDGATVHVPPMQAAHPTITAEYVSKAKSREILGNGDINPQPKAPESELQQPEPHAAPTPAAPEPAHAAPAAAMAPAAAAAVPAVTVNGDSTPTHHASGTSTPSSHPPGMSQPGPLPKHTVEMVKAITGRMDGESTSSIPETSNGAIPHPEIIVASDKSKGLAIEREKMEGIAGTNGVGRPEMQRFVTAAEF